MRRVDSLEKTLMLGGIGGRRRRGRQMAGWHYRLDGHEFGWTPGVGDGQGGLACCDSWSRKESTRLSDWTELNWKPSQRTGWGEVFCSGLLLSPPPSFILYTTFSLDKAQLFSQQFRQSFNRILTGLQNNQWGCFPSCFLTEERALLLLGLWGKRMRGDRKQRPSEVWFKTFVLNCPDWWSHKTPLLSSFSFASFT